MSQDQSKYKQTRILLGQLRHRLHDNGLWHSDPPSPSALASNQPFCCDTLMFEQWLQFVFIPRMEALCHAQGTLPAHMSLLPMAEQVWPDKDRSNALMQTLCHLDQLYQERD